MKDQDLPKEIYFIERKGSKGILCLDYKFDSDIKYIRSDLVKGMLKISLRDVFATDAMNALTNRLVIPGGYKNIDIAGIASEAYDIADEMIKARGKVDSQKKV